MRLWPIALLTLVGCEGGILGGFVKTPDEPKPVEPDPVVIVTPDPPMDPPMDPPEVFPDFVPGPLRARLLTSVQYTNSLKLLLGPTSVTSTTVTAPGDIIESGLASIGASTNSVSTSAAGMYEQNAFNAVEAAMKNATQRARLIPCVPATTTDAACMQQVVRTFGRRAFRRDLSATEYNRWQALGIQVATEYLSFDKGVTFALAGLLQSPGFLYLNESGNGGTAAGRKLDAYSLAARLSYFLTQYPPDDTLLDAAATGVILTDAGLKAQATRLLNDPNTTRSSMVRTAIINQLEEVLDLHHVDKISKDGTTFPEFNSAMALSMRVSERYALEYVTFGGRDFRELFTGTTVFYDAKTAGLYGLPPPVTGWASAALAPTGLRKGILTHPAFLAQQSHASGNSITYRGKFIRERLLCTTIDAPPTNVNTTLPNAGSAVTLRQRVEGHMGMAQCSGCHAQMDPLGFPLENFDAIGRFRTLDNGAQVDPRGSLDGKAFDDAAGMNDLLAKDPRVMRCLTRSMFRQAVGHVDERAELKPLAAAQADFEAGGYHFDTLLMSLVMSDAFRSGRSLEGTP